MTAEPIWVDDRWGGAHGIGRYAAEVVSRLALPWRPMGLAGNQSSPLDFLRRLPAGAGSGVVYSPGYGALIRAKRQALTVHDLIHLKVDWPGRAKYLAYYNGPVRRAIRSSGLVFTVSETSRGEIIDWLRDDSVRVVDAGIGCSEVFAEDGPVAPATAPYVFFIGNLRRHKNLDVVLRAFRSVRGVTLRAVLPERELAEAHRRLRELGVSERVELLHSLSDEEVAAQYRGAVATMMPSTLEGFGLPALESIRCGTPVIHWAGCAVVSETVGASGIAVDDADDGEAWADAIGRATRGPLAVDSSAERYSWDTTSSLVSAALLDALEPSVR